MAGARVDAGARALGVIIVLAIDPFPTPSEAAVRAPEELLGRYVLLKKLPAGLRAEVWLGLPPGAASLGQLVAIKAFFQHAPGPARAALSAELGLAARLTHPNIVRALSAGRNSARPFMVSEYLEGTTLHALLRRVRVARARVAPAVVARLLLAIVRAVCHAERQAASAAAKRLVRQAIAADDVFVTFDGAVKLLGFKARLASVEQSPVSAGAQPEGAALPAAIDVLLSQHLTPALRDVLAAGCRPQSGVGGLDDVERALERWQAEVLGSDGRAELAALVGTLFLTARLELRAQLEERLEQCASARSAGLPMATDADEGAPPASGFRTVGL
jgi:serine/threonine protein kinase